ncbi:MAG: T9SS type A sorting domain-containing protein [bacterium]|nr:T9SS type A sorting domain-containing protein [bacterium]
MKCRLEFFASILISSVFISSLTAVADSPPVVIGTSNSSLATAWNNARKIERTSDDIRLVVYHDSLADGPVVMWTASADGIEWSEPAILGKGEFPALAIDEEDCFYAAWADADSPAVHIVSFQRDPQIPGRILAHEPERVNLPLPSGFSIRHLSLEASGSGLHVAAEMIPAGSTRSALHYAMFEKSDFSLLCAFDFDHDLQGKGFDRSGFSARRPMISGDLEFNPGTLMIVYTDEADIPESDEIGVVLISEDAPPEWMWEYSPVLLNAIFPPELRGHSSPSVSYRSHGNDRGVFIMACSDEKNRKMTIGAGLTASDDDPGLQTTSYDAAGHAAPSVDDILPFMMTSAVLWQDGGQIYYGQAEDATLIIPPVPAGLENGVAKRHPSVCYRKFRGDLFDVVWTEGDRPPYKVMYRRMPKVYGTEPVKILTPSLNEAVYRKAYDFFFDVRGGSSGKYSYELLSGRLPGEYWLGYDDCLVLTPIESGSFPFRIKVTDYAKWSSDTADFVLVVRNSPPILSSPSVIQVTRGSSLSYQASASDPESNPITYIWTDIPSWSAASDDGLSGTAPDTASDTAFTLVASDGDMADTMIVSIHVQPDGIDANQDGTTLPSEYSLSAVFPNPFNTMTTVRFALPVSGNVRLELIGLNGELKKRVIEETFNAGRHSVTLDGADLPSGTYLIRLTTDGWSAVRKCVLLK